MIKKTAVSGSSDKTLKTWDLNSGREITTFIDQANSISSIAMTPDGRYIVSLGWPEKELKVLDLSTGSKISTLSRFIYYVIPEVRLTPDAFFAYASGGLFRRSKIKIWDLMDGHEIANIKADRGEFFPVGLTPDGRYTISQNKGNFIKIWDLRARRIIANLTDRIGLITSAVVTPDGHYAIIGTTDSILKIWDLRTCQETMSFKGHTGIVTAVSVTPDGTLLISGSTDNTLKIWDLLSGRLQSTFSCESGITALTYSDEMNSIIVGDRVGKTHILFIENYEPYAQDDVNQQISWDRLQVPRCPHCGAQLGPIKYEDTNKNVCPSCCREFRETLNPENPHNIPHLSPSFELQSFLDRNLSVSKEARLIFATISCLEIGILITGSMAFFNKISPTHFDLHLLIGLLGLFDILTLTYSKNQFNMFIIVVSWGLIFFMGLGLIYLNTLYDVIVGALIMILTIPIIWSVKRLNYL